ncbi:outer membrane protein assembly factor BamE [Piscinibacter sakaiensis]|uniref:Outer membrane protein assembly factor BamE n=1 Tax=Piscinibacter sakaiensis TaxID=1547922 RepID=A0A0K8NYR5_PISS1|nr:outer membrane protein assembly factor BamE [Piscinibacter sakaiensis]GAP35521.1 outer membrane lipoprotein SmpA [Piscinibacter sakaiensis]
MPAPTRPHARRGARFLAAPAALAAGLLLAGCGGMSLTDRMLGVVTPYKVEVVQGNVVTKEQLAAVRPGQSRAQVRDILGSPLLADIFHADRWDYVFTIRRQGAAPQQRQVIVRFEGDVLKSVDAPELPSERDFVASIDTFKTSRNAPPLALSEAQVKALPAPARAAATPAAAEQPAAELPRRYPPLEGTR